MATISNTIEQSSIFIIESNISEIFEKWKHLFHHLIIQNKSIESNNFNSLLIDSYHILNKLSINNALFSAKNKYSFHDLISLRRQIMIIAQYSYNINTTMYDKIINIFVKISTYYIKQRAINKHSWFHIHVSKAGGTTIRATFNQQLRVKHSGYLTTSQNLQCNQQYNYLRNKIIAHSMKRVYNLSIVNENNSPKNKYNHVNITGVNDTDLNGIHTTYLQREDPMLTSNDFYDVYQNKTSYNGPSLCNKFIYILPVREPIERICSQSAQINAHKIILSNQNIWRRYVDWKAIRNKYGNNEMDKDVNQCFKQNVSINNMSYRLMTQGIDYKGYFVALLKSELASNMPLTFESDVFNRLILSSYDGKYVQLPPCFKDRKHIRYFPVAVTDKLTDSEFIISSNKYMVDVAWHRTKTGSNIYTSWLGYNYSKQDNENNYIEFANYVPRAMINESHLINAIDLMMRIDYVLPFQTFTNKVEDQISCDHSIWNITLNHIKKYYGNNDNFDWLQINESDGLNKIKSFDICQYMSQKDKYILREYNKLDSRFFHFSKLIENVDVEYFIRMK